eukprot:jgi/Chlat1/3875/Chrsp26S04162
MPEAEDGAAQLAVHRKLWARDALSAEAVGDAFKAGRPVFTFKRLRLLGVVVGLHNDVDSTDLLVDDTTAVMRVRIPFKVLQFRPIPPVVGMLVDFIGSLEIATSTARAERYLLAYGLTWLTVSIDVKEDNYETLRQLEIVKLYREHYFAELFAKAVNHKPAELGRFHVQRSMVPQLSRRPPKQEPVTLEEVAGKLAAKIADCPGCSEAEIQSAFPQFNSHIKAALDQLQLDGVIYTGKDGKYCAM